MCLPKDFRGNGNTEISTKLWDARTSVLTPPRKAQEEKCPYCIFREEFQVGFDDQVAFDNQLLLPDHIEMDGDLYTLYYRDGRFLLSTMQRNVTVRRGDEFEIPDSLITVALIPTA